MKKLINNNPLDEDCLNCGIKRDGHPHAGCEAFLSPMMDAMFSLSEGERMRMAVAYNFAHNNHLPFEARIMVESDKKEGKLAIITEVKVEPHVDPKITLETWIAANLPKAPGLWLYDYLVRCGKLKR